jgi:hypothetical protein
MLITGSSPVLLTINKSNNYKSKMMFDSKKTQLFATPQKSGKTSGSDTAVLDSPFVKAGLKKKAETRSGNGALKYSTTGNDFVDQFGKLGSMKVPRSFSDVEKDSEVLYGQNKLLAVIFIFYIRMITRVVQLFDGTQTTVSQRGGELRHEGIFRMIWLHIKSPVTFWKNIGLFVSIGSWKDIFTMLQYDLVYNGWDGRKLDWEKFGQLLLSGLSNEKTSELIKKYLPQIKAKSDCKTVESQADTLIGKWLCSLLFGGKPEAGTGATYKKYRLLKSSGTAHQWQQLISQGKHNLIDFNTIHGRALNLLARSKYLKNQGLEAKYQEWITKDETEAKYTGFVHELFSKLPHALSGLSIGEQATINKQFATLVEKGGEIETETTFIVVRDTSGSMGSEAPGSGMSCYNVGKALALYFSEFLHGKFERAWIEFNSTAEMHTWKGNTPLEKWYNDHSDFVGGTDFESVVKLFAKLKSQGVEEKDFPTGILCISDSMFNPSTLGKTNVESALEILRRAGFSEEYVNKFVIVLWNLSNNHYGFNSSDRQFETYGDVPNVFYFSGYSAATVSFLMTGKVTNASELFNEAMNQEVLQMIEL